jgi:hypothetical protein
MEKHMEIKKNNAPRAQMMPDMSFGPVVVVATPLQPPCALKAYI